MHFKYFFSVLSFPDNYFFQDIFHNLISSKEFFEINFSQNFTFILNKFQLDLNISSVDFVSKHVRSRRPLATIWCFLLLLCLKTERQNRGRKKIKKCRRTAEQLEHQMCMIVSQQRMNGRKKSSLSNTSLVQTHPWPAFWQLLLLSNTRADDAPHEEKRKDILC